MLSGAVHKLLLLPLPGPAEWTHARALAVPGLAVCESNLNPSSCNPNAVFRGM